MNYTGIGAKENKGTASLKDTRSNQGDAKPGQDKVEISDGQIIMSQMGGLADPEEVDSEGAGVGSGSRLSGCKSVTGGWWEKWSEKNKSPGAFLAMVAGAFLALALPATASAQNIGTTLVAYEYSGSGGFAYSPVITQLKNPGWVVTAWCDAEDVLELASWYDTGTELVREATKRTTSSCSTTYPIFGYSVSITTVNASTVVTALADAAGDLEVSAWTVTSNPAGGNSITLLGNPYIATGWASSQVVSITKLNATQVVTASISGNSAGSEISNNYVAVWNVPSSGDISAGPYASTPMTSSVCCIYSIAATSSSQVVTAGYNPAGDLQVIAWNINPEIITLLDFTPASVTEETGGMANTGIAFGIPQIALLTAGTSTSNPVVVTSMINNSGYFPELVEWSVAGNGEITREASGYKGMPPYYTATAASVDAPLALCVVGPSSDYSTPAPVTAFSPEAPSLGSDPQLQTWYSSSSSTFNFDGFDIPMSVMPFGNSTPPFTSYVPTSIAPLATGNVSTSKFITVGVNASTYTVQLFVWQIY